MHTDEASLAPDAIIQLVTTLPVLIQINRDQARQIAANIAKRRDLLRKQLKLTTVFFSALIYINARHERLHVCTALRAPAEL